MGIEIVKNNQFLSEISGVNAIWELKAIDANLEVILLTIKAEAIMIFQPYECLGSISTYYIIEGKIKYDKDEVIISEGDTFTIKDIKEPIYLTPQTDVKLLWISSKNIFKRRKYEYSTLSEQLKNIQNKDKYTEEHCVRVACYAMRIAKKLCLSEEHIENLNSAANFHDVGKINIPIEILNKPGKLTESEFEIVKKHTFFGYDIIKEITSEAVARIVLEHHERIDGTGYPHGLKDNEISIEAKIIGVSDSYDAMTSDRPYRKAMTPIQAIEELRKYIGIQYDSTIVETLIEILKDEEILY